MRSPFSCWVEKPTPRQPAWARALRGSRCCSGYSIGSCVAVPQRSVCMPAAVAWALPSSSALAARGRGRPGEGRAPCPPCPGGCVPPARRRGQSPRASPALSQSSPSPPELHEAQHLDRGEARRLGVLILRPQARDVRVPRLEQSHGGPVRGLGGRAGGIGRVELQPPGERVGARVCGHGHRAGRGARPRAGPNVQSVAGRRGLGISRDTRPLGSHQEAVTRAPSGRASQTGHPDAQCDFPRAPSPGSRRGCPPFAWSDVPRGPGATLLGARPGSRRRGWCPTPATLGRVELAKFPASLLDCDAIQRPEAFQGLGLLVELLPLGHLEEDMLEHVAGAPLLRGQTARYAEHVARLPNVVLEVVIRALVCQVRQAHALRCKVVVQVEEVQGGRRRLAT